MEDLGLVDRCRLCDELLGPTFLDLGSSPLANSLVEPDALHLSEACYPLHARICASCLLVQLPEAVSPTEIFDEYVYFSSYSETRLANSRLFVEQITRQLGLDQDAHVVEIASNDGYLLQFFEPHGVPVLGIEPAANVARAAEARGVPTRVAFFDEQLADQLTREKLQADLIIGNNVLAHVPKLNDFIRGLRRLLKPAGRISIEVPHLLELIEQNQFDTIYHEHFSYFSLHTAEQAFARHDLRVVDVEQIPDQGGSLRLDVRHWDAAEAQTPRLLELRAREAQAGLHRLDGHAGFASRAERVKASLLEFLRHARQTRKRVAAYGAPAKGNTLLNYCGVQHDLIHFTVDRSPHKQGRFLPGSRIPILDPQAVAQQKPDYLLILPWNLKQEIISQMRTFQQDGGQFVVPIPELAIVT